MSRIEFTDDVSPALQRGNQFPKLKLKKDEKARICVLEAPEQVYVHELREPVLINGHGNRVVKKNRNQDEYEDWEDKFIATFQCLGDEETMFQQGVDVKNCPACEASSSFDRFRPAVPKFGLNIIKYSTKPGTAEVTKTFAVTAELWTFGPAKYEEIRGLVKDGNYDLKTHDLILGPCSNELYQKFNIMVAQDAAWMATDETKKHTAEVFNENRVQDKDLPKAVAPLKDRAQVEALVNRVKRGWDAVNGVSMSNTDQILAAAGADTSGPNLGTPPGPSVTVAEPETSSSFADLLGTLKDIEL